MNLFPQRQMHSFALLSITVGLLLVVIPVSPETPDLEDYRDGYVYMPKDGFVPDSTTAVAIAEAVWRPMYGDVIDDSMPFKAKLQGDSLWIVDGTLPEEYVLGGTPYPEIMKADGRIVCVTHFK